jgi:hypothetical protein
MQILSLKEGGSVSFYFVFLKKVAQPSTPLLSSPDIVRALDLG